MQGFKSDVREKLKDYYGDFLKFTKSDLIRYAYNEVDYVFDNILLPRERDIIQRIYGKSLRDDYCTNNVEPYEEEYYQRVIVPKMIRNIQSLNINNRGDINTNNMTPLILQRR